MGEFKVITATFKETEKILNEFFSNPDYREVKIEYISLFDGWKLVVVIFLKKKDE
jgi:hypothetical protein